MIPTILRDIFLRMRNEALTPGNNLNTPAPDDPAKARGWFTMAVSKPNDILDNDYVNDRIAQAEMYVADNSIDLGEGFARPVTIDTVGTARLVSIFGFQYPRMPDIRLEDDEKERSILDTEVYVDCSCTVNASPREFQQQMIYLASILEYPNCDMETPWNPDNISSLRLEEMEILDSELSAIRESYLQFRIIA